jgi:FKBP-type peptidyl-prolyl cis-trans isomerase
MRAMKIWAVMVSLALLAVVVPASAQTTDLSVESNAAFLAANAKKPGVFRRASGVQYKILQSGFGKRPGATDTVSVYYTGTLINGALFDGTSPGLPASMKLGRDLVPGFQEALQMMREGDHWIVWIPANLAYGAKGGGGGTIPPYQTLIFDLRLISTTPAPKPGDPDYVPDPHDPDAVAAAQQGH